MSFWETDLGSTLLSQKSPFEHLLDQADTKLELVLDQDDLLQQCSNKNANLVEWLSQPQVVRRMIEYITFSVEANVAKYSEEHGIHLDANDIEPPSFGVTLEQVEQEQKTSDATPPSPSLSVSSRSSDSDSNTEEKNDGDSQQPPQEPQEPQEPEAASTTDPQDELAEQLENVHISEENKSATDVNGVLNEMTNGIPENAEVGNADEPRTPTPPEEDTTLEEKTDSDTKNLLEKIRVKFPYLCSEILASQLGPVLDCIMSPDNGFLDLLFEHIRRDPPLDAVLTNYWRTAVVALTRREPKRIIQYFRDNNDILDRLIQHISDQSIMELVITLGWDPLIEELPANLDEIADWMREQNLIPKLIEMMRPNCTPNDHSAASYTLVDIVAKSQRCTNLTLFDHLSSGEEVRNLMTGIFVQDQSAMLESLSVLIALLHHYPNLRAEKQMALERERMGRKKPDGDSTSSDSEEGNGTGEKEEAIPPVIVAVLERIEDFKNLLARPPDQPMELSVGTLNPPLGPVRLKVVDLLVAVMRTPYPPMAIAFREKNIVGLCLGLFFEYPWNNLLHGSVEHIIQMTLSGQSEILKEALFEDCTFLKKILAARERSLQHQRDTGLRLGYTGHLTRISNTVVEFAKRDAYLETKMKEEEAWQQFMQEGLRQENDKLNVQLGGQRPPQLLGDDDIMFHIDLGEKDSATGKILDSLEMNLKPDDEYRLPSDEDLTFGEGPKEGANQDWGAFGSWPFEEANANKPANGAESMTSESKPPPPEDDPHSSDEDEPEIPDTPPADEVESQADDFTSFLSSDSDLFFADPQATGDSLPAPAEASTDATKPDTSSETTENKPTGDGTFDDWGDGDVFANFDFDGPPPAAAAAAEPAPSQPQPPDAENTEATNESSS